MNTDTNTFIEELIGKVKNYPIVKTNNPCVYSESKVVAWLDNPKSCDPVKLASYLGYCERNKTIEVYGN